MEVRLELLKGAVSDLAVRQIENLDIDVNEIAQTTAIAVLSDIQEILKDNSLSDFDAIEKIVITFEKYHITSGERHDF